MINHITIWIFYIITIYFLNKKILSKNFLRSNTGSKHQLFANESIPLTGGIFILFPILLIYLPNNFLICLFFILIFLTGLLSDLNFLISPKKRFFLQLFFISAFIFYTKLEVLPTKIDFIDNLIDNTFFSYVLTIFCLMILINGSNFIDGLNGLFLGYIIIIFLILLKTNLFYSLGFSVEQFSFLIMAFIFILILNYSNQLFMGDSGAYALSFLIGLSLIYIYNFTSNLSPFFIILLLWYPCFENLFSIIRKFTFRKSPLKPDNKHLHQYLFQFFIKKFNIKKIYANNLASITINTFNLIIFLIGSLNISHTAYQIKLIIFSVIFYLAIYKLLKIFSNN